MPEEVSHRSFNQAQSTLVSFNTTAILSSSLRRTQHEAGGLGGLLSQALDLLGAEAARVVEVLENLDVRLLAITIEDDSDVNGLVGGAVEVVAVTAG